MDGVGSGDMIGAAMIRPELVVVAREVALVLEVLLDQLLKDVFLHVGPLELRAALRDQLTCPADGVWIGAPIQNELLPA